MKNFTGCPLFFRTALTAILILGFQGLAQSYDILERYQLIYDKSLNDDVYRPLGHDFLLDIRGQGSDGLVGFVSDISDATDVEASNVAEEIQLVQDILQKVNDEEHYFNVRVTAGIPLPKFRAFGVGIVPDVRASYDVGGAVSITDREEAIDLSLLGGDSATPDPSAQLYVKVDSKVGLNVNLEHSKNWFSATYLYWMSRWDRSEYLVASEIVTDDTVIDLDKPKNTQTFAMADVTVGYRSDEKDRPGFRAFAQVHELELSRLSDKIDTAGNLVYDITPLFRLHADMNFDLSVIDIRPFVGVHSRDGYDTGDGLYGGAEIDFSFLPLSVVGMVDPDYLTVHPKLNLWLFKVDYSAKIPLNSEIDGYDTAIIHTANLRFAF